MKKVLLLICLIALSISYPYVNRQSSLEEIRECYVSMTSTKQQVGFDLRKQFDSPPFAIRAEAELVVKDGGIIVHGAGAKTVYRLKHRPEPCTDTIKFGSGTNVYQNRELFFSIHLFTFNCSYPFTIIEFNSTGSLSDGIYALEDENSLLRLIAKTSSTENFLTHEPNFEPNYLDSFNLAPYDGKCVCAIQRYKISNLLTVISDATMASADKYNKFSISIENMVNENQQKSYKVDIPAFPCACRPLESQSNINFVIPADFEQGILTAYQNNIDTGEQFVAIWDIKSADIGYNNDISAFRIANAKIVRLNPTDRKLNDPNTIYLMDLETVTRKCENNDKITTTSKYIGDDIYEFSYTKTSYLGTGKLSQQLTSFQNPGICTQFMKFATHRAIIKH